MRLYFRDLHYGAPPQFHHLMGLGDVCVPGPYGSDANGPLCLDQNTGSPVSCSDPRCGAGGGGSVTPASNTPTYIPQTNPTFVNVQFGNTQQPVFTLDSYLSQWVSGITGQSLDSLANQGMNSVSAILSQLAAIAQQYCDVEGPPDCSNISALVSKYSAMIQVAYSHVAASQWNPATFTAYAAPTLPPSGPAPQLIVPPATSIPASGITPPATPVLAPSAPAAKPPATSGAPSGSPAGSSNTNTNTTNFLTEQSISGIPNWALLTAAAVGLFMFAGGRR